MLVKRAKAKSDVKTASDTNPSAELNDMIYTDAISYIQSAIESLGAVVRRSGDARAKEAIANLSVVLLDLKS